MNWQAGLQLDFHCRVQQELQTETKKTVELIDSLEQQSAHLYHAEPMVDMPYIPPNTTLTQKAGYLFLRRLESGVSCGLFYTMCILVYECVTCSQAYILSHSILLELTCKHPDINQNHQKLSTYLVLKRNCSLNFKKKKI